MANILLEAYNKPKRDSFRINVGKDFYEITLTC